MVRALNCVLFHFIAFGIVECNIFSSQLVSTSTGFVVFSLCTSFYFGFATWFFSFSSSESRILWYILYTYYTGNRLGQRTKKNVMLRALLCADVLVHSFFFTLVHINRTINSLISTQNRN
jgi:hypothetical protein